MAAANSISPRAPISWSSPAIQKGCSGHYGQRQPKKPSNKGSVLRPLPAKSGHWARLSGILWYKRDHLSEAAMTPTPRLAFITVVATLAYFGLAILGWGGFAAFFSHPALIALTIALFVL